MDIDVNEHLKLITDLKVNIDLVKELISENLLLKVENGELKTSLDGLTRENSRLLSENTSMRRMIDGVNSMRDNPQKA